MMIYCDSISAFTSLVYVGEKSAFKNLKLVSFVGHKGNVITSLREDEAAARMKKCKKCGYPGDKRGRSTQGPPPILRPPHHEYFTRTHVELFLFCSN